MSDAACPAGEACAWPTEPDSCSTFTGTCVLLDHEPCDLQEAETACGCGGMDVTWTTGCAGIPRGWAPSPVEHMGSCADAGP